MTDYNAYRASKGLSHGDMIAAVKTRFPKYTKVQQSFVSNPDKTGVCLLPEAEYALVDRYGFGVGLSIVDDGSYSPMPVPEIKPRRKPVRKKPHGYTVRFNSETNEAIHSQMRRLNISTVQEYMEEAVRFFLQCGLGEV